VHRYFPGHIDIPESRHHHCRIDPAGEIVANEHRAHSAS